jgi:hypothetical protein
VKALCYADNEPSWRLMERLGMRREEYAVQDSLHRTKGWLDGMTYAVLADEWRARTAGCGAKPPPPLPTLRGLDKLDHRWSSSERQRASSRPPQPTHPPRPSLVSAAPPA